MVWLFSLHLKTNQNSFRGVFNDLSNFQYLSIFSEKSCNSIGGMTMTLDDVSCPMNLPIESGQLDHNSPRDKEIDLIVELLGSHVVEVEYQVPTTKCAHAQFSLFRNNFKLRLETKVDKGGNMSGRLARPMVWPIESPTQRFY